MDRASVFVWQFSDALSTRQRISLKISTKIIFDLSQWQHMKATTLPLTKKAAISSFMLTTFRGVLPVSQWLCGNRPRDLCRGSCVDIFRQWKHLWKHDGFAVLPEQKSSCRTCAEACHSPFKAWFPYDRCDHWEKKKVQRSQRSYGNHFPAIAATKIAEIEKNLSKRSLSLRSLRSLESGFLMTAMIAEIYNSKLHSSVKLFIIVTHIKEPT